MSLFTRLSEMMGRLSLILYQSSDQTLHRGSPIEWPADVTISTALYNSFRVASLQRIHVPAPLELKLGVSSWVRLLYSMQVRTGTCWSSPPTFNNEKTKSRSGSVPERMKT